MISTIQGSRPRPLRSRRALLPALRRLLPGAAVLILLVLLAAVAQHFVEQGPIQADRRGHAAAAAPGLENPAVADALPPASNGTTPPVRPADATVTTPLEVGLALLGLLALMVGLLWVVARFLRRARLAPGRHRLLRLEDALPLGARRFVYVVGFRDRTLILAGGQEEVRLLAEYGEEDWSSPAEEARRPETLSRRNADAAEDPVAPGRTLPPGAHRVPAAFRHLLHQTLAQEKGAS